MNSIAAFCLLFHLCMLMRDVSGRKSKQKNEHSGIIQICGFRDASDHVFGFNRIVGGENAEKNEFKWQISIRLKYGNKYHHICGGTIIGRSWVATAAHCVREFKKEEISIVAGEHLINTNDGSEQKRTPDLFIEHENYHPITQKNDIALIRLSREFDFTTLTVAPACLPSPTDNFTGDCIVTGWGKRREGGKNSNILQKVWLPLMLDATCKTKLKKIGYDELISDTMICAGNNAGGKDACQGDSGGPLVCPGKGDLPILVGIVSWGIGCARKDIPGVYTEVSHYINWINKKIKENSPITINRGPFPDRFKWWNFQSQTNKPSNHHIQISDIIPIIFPHRQNAGNVGGIRSASSDSEESDEDSSDEDSSDEDPSEEMA